MEQWRSIPEFPSYEVSDLGRVRHVVVLKPHTMKTGHQVVSIGRHNKRLVHRLVLQAFVGPPPPGTEGCHWPDHDPRNNALTNLRWDTRKGNMADMVRAGRARGKVSKGAEHGNAKFSEADVVEMRRLRAAGAKLSAIAEKFGTTKTTIGDIVNGKSWKHSYG